jgi:hypothetical protein
MSRSIRESKQQTWMYNERTGKEGAGRGLSLRFLFLMKEDAK